MRILIVSPLYPPDIELSAVYAKELAKRLSGKHDISVLTYGALVEPLEHVSMQVIPKFRPLPLRLLDATLWLMQNLHAYDRALLLNGPSVELPFLVANLFAHKRFTYIISDSRAHAYAMTSKSRSLFVKTLQSQADKVIPTIPESKPEILPWAKVPANTEVYDESWREHLSLIENI